MRRALWMILVALLLAACQRSPAPTAGAPTSAPVSTSAPTSAPTAAPAPSSAPTSAPTVAPSSAPAPTAAPTSAPTSAPAPTAAPTAAPTSAPTSAPAPTAALPPIAHALEPRDQAAALLPDARADLDGAGAWNRYTIVGAIDPQARTLTGREQVEYRNRDDQPLGALYFHLYPNLQAFNGQLDIGAVAIDGTAAKVVYERGHYLLRVDLPQPLAPGAATVLTIDFTTSAPLNASRDFYGAFNEEDGVLALASSYPIAAIVRHGAWDIADPSDRGDFVNSETALYDVTLTAPEDWTLVTTGVALSEQTRDGQRTQRFVSGPQRDFTISAVQLSQVSADVDGTHITSYYRTGSAEGGRGALRVAQNALHVFNQRFGRYPLAELDIIQIDARSFLGVEYPGLIMIEANLYGRPLTLETTVAHEVAHQWWYSQVGNDVQTEAWLDEALASYAQIVYQADVHGADAAERELESFRQRYRDARSAGRDAPVERPTAAFSGNYVALVYGKAVLFFQALRARLGDELFWRFLQGYYAQHRYGFVSGADLLASAEGACGCDLHGLYSDWITTTAPVEIP